MNFRPFLSWKWWTFWKALLNKSCSEWCSKQNALFIYSLPAPIRELQGLPPEVTFYSVSKTVKNLWSLVEFVMTRPFDRCQDIGAGPLSKGPRRGWYFWHKSLVVSKWMSWKCFKISRNLCRNPFPLCHNVIKTPLKVLDDFNCNIRCCFWAAVPILGICMLSDLLVFRRCCCEDSAMFWPYSIVKNFPSLWSYHRAVAYRKGPIN